MSAATDTLGDQIVAAGLAANSFLLDINGALHVPRFPFLPVESAFAPVPGAARSHPAREGRAA
jgi:hypothetical protein